MNFLAKKIKSIVKESELRLSESEEGLLHRYLLSRGIDPRYVTKDTRISHSKSGQFLKWKSDHQADITNESVDKKDTVTFDIPLLIRVLELAREDIKSDMDLHRVVERLINMRDKGMLTMDDYDAIAAIKEDVMSLVSLDYIKEAIRELSEGKESNYGGDYQQSVLALKAKAEKKPVDMKSLAARMQASYAKDKKEVKEETVLEGNGYDDNRTGFAKKPREDDEGHATTKFKAKDPMSRPHTVHIDGKPWKKFSSGHQANAAVKTLTSKGKKAVAIAHFKEDTLDGATEQTSTGDGYTNMNPTIVKQQLSKSARMIKAIYKHHRVVKEDMYDYEKDDKSIATYGKKPKMDKMEKDAEPSTSKIQAAAVLSGGSTLTGQSRDTVEIDPIMRVRPGSPDPTKSVKK